MRLLILSFFFFSAAHVTGQGRYADSLAQFRAAYISDHEVVKGEAQQAFRFYPIDSSARVVALFEPAKDDRFFEMETSGSIRKSFRLYGTLHFSLHGQAASLQLYQSQNLMAAPEYVDYLFLPFTDATCGLETYSGGRYLDIDRKDIREGLLIVDFNKAYNPYCAYGLGKYNCPIPPAANRLAIPIRAGEKSFSN